MRIEGNYSPPSEGLTYAYDMEQKNPGDTILWVKIKDKFIDPNAIFCIVTTDWIGDEVKKLYPTKAVEEDLDVLKIFEMVIIAQLNKANVYEKFGERIFPMQTPQYQAGLMQQPGNSRADDPGFNRYKMEINVDAQQRNFERQKESSESSLSATPVQTISSFVGDFFKEPAENADNSAATSNSAIVYKK